MKPPCGIRSLARCATLAAGFLLPAGTAHAYVGPGLGAGALAIVLAVVASACLAVFAVVWYPLKRLMKKRRAAVEAADRPRPA